LVQEGVDLRSGQLVEPPMAATGVVDDEDVERPKGVGGGRDDTLRLLGVGEVSLNEGHRQFGGDRLSTSRFRAPTLRRIVRRPAVHEHGRTRIQQLARDRMADPSTTTDTGNKRIAARQLNEQTLTPRPGPTEMKAIHTGVSAARKALETGLFCFVSRARGSA